MVRGFTLDDTVRRTIFANIDTLTTALTFLLQLFGVSIFLRRGGVGLTLAILPAIYFVGFLGFAVSPVLGSVVIFEILRRGVGYGVASPSRELLFTVVSAEEKYKSKACIDTLVYRGGDAAAAQLFPLLMEFLSVARIALLAAPLCLVWIALARILGRDVSELSGDPAVTADGESGHAP